MTCVWNDEEVKALFNLVEEMKRSKRPIREAFNKHALNYGRQPNSVRNYYYHEIDRLEEDKLRRSNLQIDIKKHQKNEFNFFTDEEKDAVINKIKEKLSEGYSVRKACMLLSGGDVKQMLRLQNKYRSTLVDKPKENNNILKFKIKPSTKITDSDINGLFLGLAKLIKRIALEEAKSEIADEKIERETTIRNMVIDLGKKDRQIKFLKDEAVLLKRENANLKKKLLIASCLKARTLTKKDKEA